MASHWIDISVPLRSGMVNWPNDPPVSIERVLDMNRGDKENVSKIHMSSHTGTHLDAPVHYLVEGVSISDLPLDAVMGPARVIEIQDLISIKVSELQRHQLLPGERILFKTANSGRCWKTDAFVEDFVYVSEEAAAYLASVKPKLVGIDYLSVGGFKVDGKKIHEILLQESIWILEGLNLEAVEPGNYDLICLPIKIAGGDGAPARAIITRR